MSATKQEQYKTAMGKYDYLAPNEITVCIPKAEYEELLKIKHNQTANAVMVEMAEKIESLEADNEQLRKAVPEIELPELELENV